MVKNTPLVLQQLWRSAAASSLAIVLLTGISYRLQLNEATVVLLYLLVVVLQSLAGRFMSSAIVAAVATASLDFFFLPPLMSFRIAEPRNVVVLFVFLVTAFVVTHLVSRVRAAAENARQHGAEVEQLYEVAQRLFLVDPGQTGSGPLLRVFREALRAEAVCLFDATTMNADMEGESQHNLAVRTREAYSFGKDADDSTSAVSVRCLRIGTVNIGAIGFEGIRQREALPAAFPALAAAALERAQSFRRASREAAAAEAETFRTAILDALAHEFKTPLATILAVIGGIRESGRLEPEQVEMAEMIEDETSRLSALTTRLLQTAKLDREQLKPRMKRRNVFPLVELVVRRYADQSRERRVCISSEGHSFEARVDGQLFDLALTQLLDNAFKYSPPASTISLELRRTDDFITISVGNEGSSIASEEQDQIFERFYRGTSVRGLVSGTGLGLYVARKIAAAHGGSLELRQQLSSKCVIFCLKLPAVLRSTTTTNHGNEYISTNR